MNILNSDLDPPPVLGLSINCGDEVSGLFEEVSPVYRIVDEVRDILCSEAGIHYVVVRGKIGHNSDGITQVGGEILKRANDAMKRLKRKNRFCYWDTGKGLQDKILISLSELTNTLIERMTEYQYKAYNLLKRGFSQKEIAARLDKYQQSVSDAVGRGNAELVIDAENRITEILNSGSSIPEEKND
ncbi:MAG: hypothetical protein GF417_11910 [Candidatus Latescibacteria bacterium]|nr:hypothetical protein [Candidatus Latescibacterota bacterium]